MPGRGSTDALPEEPCSHANGAGNGAFLAPELVKAAVEGPALRNGFGEPRDGEPKSRLSRPRPASLGMGFGSRTLAARAAKTPQFFTMLAAASEGTHGHQSRRPC